MKFEEMQNVLNDFAQGAKIIEFLVEHGTCTIKFKYRRGPIKEMTFYVQNFETKYVPAQLGVKLP